VTDDTALGALIQSGMDLVATAPIGELTDRVVLENGGRRGSRLCGAGSFPAASKCSANRPTTPAVDLSSVPEHGALAATAFGAGFGGSVWALVDAGQAAEFSAR